ncbi:NAD(P)/FAD-dependent oxidoreductase [Mycobacterium sherrisii]|uniref:FAD-dependent oxidoreductase n=1 Tax=Mycobacterium sherrisii TaxID=243061 RepID=A0A1E3T2P7_9MYCO|nr:FAD-binding oxidoreductase [Mycobacterium sherrisii]MCV7029877.1 FAD-binding oxidoreductase [Mycobacterium sherrisii]MEC4762583.1 FAD-binding oxidoreductase [Mycobacterium sherrisii]ODR08702.1 FAD-dependent oxidoreductase [Mycobacterium sherrisii]ORW85045.1 FAD-dependent oxidoreductase [Mycobacterium sherrisii]
MIVIVGAGICGLSTAYELSRRGENVVVFERGEPFAEQSAGLARIFRIAHRRAALCRLALRARDGWRRWESELDTGRLLGSEGFIAAAPPAATVTAMTEAGAEFSWLDGRGIQARIPFVAPAWQTGIFDPLGGSLRIRRALTALAARVEIRRGRVVSLGDDGSVRLADGTVTRGDGVVVCAGAHTTELLGPLDVEFAPHTRFTYQGGDAVGAACLSAPEGYGLPLGSTGRWAFGQESPDPAGVRALFPSLSPVGQVDCVTVRAPWLDAGGDGWLTVRRGRVVGFVGSNLMKFGPVLGELLAQAALGDGLPSELTLE